MPMMGGGGSPGILPLCQLRLRSSDNLLGPELRDSLDQPDRNGLRERKAQRALTRPVRCELALEGCHQLIARRVDRVVLLPRREAQQRTLGNLVRGHLIADDLNSSGNGLADDGPDTPQNRLDVLRLRADVLGYGLEVGLGHPWLSPQSCSAVLPRLACVRPTTIQWTASNLRSDPHSVGLAGGLMPLMPRMITPGCSRGPETR